MTTVSPTETVWSVPISVSRSVPSAEPRSMPCALLDCTIAETEEFSSEMRRTVELAGPHSMIWPMAPLESETGMPTARLEVVPLSIVTVSLHESVEAEMMRAAVDWRL